MRGGQSVTQGYGLSLGSLYHDARLRRFPLLRSCHDQIRRSPIMQAYWLTYAHYIVISSLDNFAARQSYKHVDSLTLIIS